jgi:hypothetical protein
VTGCERLAVGASADDADLRAALSAIEPRGRELLRRYRIADQPDRDEVATTLLHYGDRNGAGRADVIDLLTMHSEVRRRVVRLLGELERRAVRQVVPSIDGLA